MPHFATYLQMAADGTRSAVNPASLSAGGKDVVGTKAAEAVSSGVFPLEVAFILIGCLLVSGFVLLARESRLEKQADA